jgi:hypothetical protein
MAMARNTAALLQAVVKVKFGVPGHGSGRGKGASATGLTRGVDLRKLF